MQPQTAYQIERTYELLSELRRRSEHEFHKYKPYGGQIEFHQSDKYVRCVFGGNQSGKSRCGAQEIAWWYTHTHPYLKTPDRPVTIWVTSTEYRTIKNGVYRHLNNIIPDWDIKDRGPKIQGFDINSYIKSPRGDTIEFISAKGADEARQKFQAAEVDLMCIDEEVENYIWDEVQARMLTSGGRIIFTATLVESYDWVVGLEKKGELKHRDTFLTRLSTLENPYVNQDQVKRLIGEDGWDADTQRYRIYGKSRRSSGLVYKTWGRHHVLDTFKIPIHWTKTNILDPGFRVCASLWFATTPKNQHICYRELYVREETVDNVAEEIKLLEGSEIIDYRIIDDKYGSKLITGELGVLHRLAEYYNLYYSPAMKSKHYGIECARGLLKDRQLEGFNEYTLDDGEIIAIPQRYHFFTFDNPNFYEEMGNYRIRPMKAMRNKNEPVDAPLKQHDHTCDCFRYFATSNVSYFERPQVIAKRPKHNVNVGSSLEELLEQWMDTRGHTKRPVHDLLGSEF